MISKDQLVFDATDAETLASSDNVGAYVRSSDGTLITHTTSGGKEALDVSFVNTTITVTATDLDIRDLTAATDSVQSWLRDGAGTAITSTAGALDVNLKSPIVVDVSTSHLNDSMRLGDGTNFLTSTTVGGDIGLDVNIINPSLVVTATDLDIRDLVAATDSVSSWTKDGTGNSIGSTSGSLNVNITNSLTVSDAALANTAVAHSVNTLNVANTAEAVVTSALASRKYLLLRNNSNKSIYIGTTGVTSANGFPISASSVAELRLGAAVSLQWVGPDAGQEIRVLELS